MNRRRTIVPLILVLLLFGCSTTPDRIVLNTLETSKATADAAMRTLATGYAQGRAYDVGTKTWSVTNPALVVVSDDTKTTAIAAYDKFAAVAKTTALALKAVGTQQQADALTKDLTVALSELLRTLQLLGVKL